jgi:hypothetical protein
MKASRTMLTCQQPGARPLTNQTVAKMSCKNLAVCAKIFLMKIFAPGDDQYEAILKDILAYLDERQQKRLHTPEYDKLMSDLAQLEAKLETAREARGPRKMTDDESFAERKLQKKCGSIKTRIEHHIDDWHQAERGYRKNRRQFEEALEKHARVLRQRGRMDEIW